MAEKERAVEDPSPLVTVITWAAVSIFLAIIFIFTAPISALVSGGEYALAGTIHGLFATLGVLVGSVTAYLGWRLFIGRIRAFGNLKILSLISVFLSVATIIYGNWIYIGYRAPGGPRAFFMKASPVIHGVFFEFKEFIALFPLPLTVAATFIIWRYGNQLIQNKALRYLLGVIFAIAWGGLIIAYLLGAGITKLKSV